MEKEVHLYSLCRYFACPCPYFAAFLEYSLKITPSRQRAFPFCLFKPQDLSSTLPFESNSGAYFPTTYFSYYKLSTVGWVYWPYQSRPPLGETCGSAEPRRQKGKGCSLAQGSASRVWKWLAHFTWGREWGCLNLGQKSPKCTEISLGIWDNQKPTCSSLEGPTELVYPGAAAY